MDNEEGHKNIHGLPGDLDVVRSKLELYFKNKRKSGGEVLNIQEHPDDKRKALLMYLLDTDLNNVLKQGTHKIDFKALGVAEVSVKLLHAKNDRVKPPLMKKPKIETQVKSAEATCTTGIQTSGSKDQKGNDETPKPECLLISSGEPIEEEILSLYFEHFTEKAEFTKCGKNKWILKVANHLDLSSILAEEKHDFGLTVELYKEGSAEQRDPRRFILTGFKDSCKCKLISLFIGSCSPKVSHSWELVDDGRIVVIFNEEVDSTSFIGKCASKKFQDMEIEAAHLALTDSLLVQGNMSKLTKEALTLYFENHKKSGGGDIKLVKWVNEQTSVVITFQDCHVPQDVVKRKHLLCGVELSTLLFYSNLRKALTGETPTWSNIDTDIVIRVHELVRGFIETNEKCKNEFESNLKVVHANVIFDQTSPKAMSLEMAVDKESLAALRLGATWASKVEREAQRFLNRYSKAEFPAEIEVWKRVEQDCLGFVTPGVNVTYTETKVGIVGLETEVAAISDKIQNLVKKATADLERERSIEEKVIQFDSIESLELVEKRVQAQLQNVTVKINEANLTIQLQGLKDFANAAERLIKQAQENVAFHQPNLSAHLLQFLQSFDLKKFEQSHFVANHIPALFASRGDRVGIVAEKGSIKNAEDKVKSVLKEEVVQLTPDVNAVINTDHWAAFLNQAKLELGHNSLKVSVVSSAEHVVICGFAEAVANLSKKVKDYLENQTPVTEDVHLKSVQEVGFLDSCMNLAQIPEVQTPGVTVQSCATTNPPLLRVTATKEKIQQVLAVVKRHISAILTEKHTYSKAGESKVILKHEANIQAKAKEWGCKAYVSTSTTGPSKKYSHQVNSSITLTVAEGELHHFRADALICPVSTELAFDNPVAQSFLQVAGSDIQAVCDRLLKEKQTLEPGKVLLSDPGTLNAKTLVYTVLPQIGQQSDSRYLDSAALNSLREADSKSSTSIAMPAIGCGSFGFTARDSCIAIRDAVLQFINDPQNPPKNIKNIFVIEPDLNLLDEFNSIISRLGFSSTTPTKTATSQDQSGVLNPDLKSRSDTEVKVYGVRVSLKKGDITKETVDVIVNSNNKALDLNTGVSGAILKAAGSTVEDECKKHGPQKGNGVVLTSGGNLSCEHIAQMVGPNTAADITSSMEAVLNLCQTTGAATVAVPAIGTGRGGIQASDSIQAIVAALENHLTRSTSSRLQKITVVAFEEKIFDGYRKYFQDRNSKTNSATTSTSIPANKVRIGDAWIEIRKGSITSESVRGIVNTTNSQMNLTGGVSGAIFTAAGPTVQQECQQHGPIKSDTVAVTSAGKLQCDFIIHMMGPHSAAEARLRVTKVLESCEEKQIATVSFPAVGTGGGGVSNLDSVTAMLQGFHDHLYQRCAGTFLKLIYIIIDRDEVMKDFQKGLTQWVLNSQVNEECEESYGSDEESLEDEEEEIEEEEETEEEEEEIEEEEEEDSSGSITEAIIGAIKVKVLCGDITKETTDAIVSSTNTDLNLSSGVSGAILKAAGQTVVDECKKLGVQPSDGVVLTTAGNLPIKHIVHMVGQTKKNEITTCMYKVLKLCEENQIQSVAFPALGTGAGNMAASQVANAMMDALANFSIDSPSFLKNVHIVIFQSEMFSDFEDSMKKFKRISRNRSPANVSNPAPRISNTARFCLAAQTASVTFPVTNVDLYGTSSADMSKVKKFLDDLISDEWISMDVESTHLGNVPETDNKKIVELSRRNQAQVLVAAVDKLIVSGKREDVLDIVLNIKNFIQDARDREIREGEEMRLSKTLRWEVAKGETWLPLNSIVSYEMELAFHKKEPKFIYKDKGEDFTVDFKEMKRVNSKGKTRAIKRTLLVDSDTAIIQPPATWSKMNGNDLEVIVLAPNSEEYKNIEKDFVRSSQHQDVPPVEVVQIRRIQSRSQWQRYCVLKQAVDKKYPKQKNEHFLYHGTTKDICQKINKNGFNRSFCGRNAVVHGEGTYFAREAWYSCHDHYSNPDETGLKYIYRARVVTGSACKSQKGMKEPDPLDPKDPRSGLYDCAVDNLQNPFIFVVFCDAGAYPDYLISFKNI